MNTASALRKHVKSYCKVFCQRCKAETIAAKIRPEIAVRLIQLMDIRLLAQKIFDPKYDGLLCLRCGKTPARGVRFRIALLGWLMFTLVACIALVSFLTDDLFKTLHGHIDWGGVYATAAFLLLGQLILLAGLHHRRTYSNRQQQIEPFKAGDPCPFCQTSLEQRHQSLTCPNCEIAVEQ